MGMNTNGNFEISVVIPVYNAAAFVTQAVESALSQPEVREVILVEDCSPDDSLAICRQLAGLYPQVKLFQHPGGINRGAGPSRNLGIISSTCPYIAFLDADDFYLANRFVVARSVFEQNPDCDGVYDAVGMYYEDEAGRERWREHSITGEGVTTLPPAIAPDDLFSVLIKGGQGHIHLNGLTISRKILEKSNLFTELPGLESMHEDTDFILRLAAVGCLSAGNITLPSAMRRVHSQNRVSVPRSGESIRRDRIRLRIATYRWLRRNGSPEQRRLGFRRLLLEWTRATPKLSKAAKLSALLRFPFSMPSSLLEGHYWHELARTFWAMIRLEWLRLR
ncbi:MAG TPA: glycosyltransferase family 2 protein [Clostridiaceae bacterium]|nr:glycosyltransferase family 2 protein [Clostridiaceae bacterium]